MKSDRSKIVFLPIRPATWGFCPPVNLRFPTAYRIVQSMTRKQLDECDLHDDEPFAVFKHYTLTGTRKKWRQGKEKLTGKLAPTDRPRRRFFVARRKGRREQVEADQRHVGVDKGYDVVDFVMERREKAVTPPVAQHTNGRLSAIDGRTTRHSGFAVSRRIRKRVEEAFGWTKIVAGCANCVTVDCPRWAGNSPSRWRPTTSSACRSCSSSTRRDLPSQYPTAGADRRPNTTAAALHHSPGPMTTAQADKPLISGFSAS